MLALGGPLVEDDVYVDMRRYRYYSERMYVSNPCDLPAEQRKARRRRYIVRAGT